MTKEREKCPSCEKQMTIDGIIEVYWTCENRKCVFWGIKRFE